MNEQQIHEAAEKAKGTIALRWGALQRAESNLIEASDLIKLYKKIQEEDASRIRGLMILLDGKEAKIEGLTQEVERLRKVAAKAGADEVDLCPNCVTPWVCNGPHMGGDSDAK